jgi:hypothetical protein
MATFRLLVPLPAVVDGGLTKWTVRASTYGKGHGRMEVVAQCLNDGRRVVITDGRESAVVRELRLGFTARPSTFAAKILCRLVRDGRAEIVS